MKACRALDLSTITLLLTSVFQSVWSLSSRVSSAVCTSNATASHDLRNYVLHRRATLAGENKSFSTDQYAFQEETHFRGSYDFRRESIPRVHAYDTSLLLSYMKNRKPVVITGANVLGPAQTVWDFEDSSFPVF
ncbi:uncharacterized protein LOC134188529 [Corticium candelabrum]|uniref:uncharacterized protein LOC134188529 n=1 Tax=Corticium candelabrum TaxID=121492 RepID=UPI002E26D5D6|nr:uncharacterized protein LOC134188529 [Corticium candelabrum]